MRALGTGAHVGAGRAFIAEADESDRSFLNYEPLIEVVTNVEPDHLDNYGTPEAFERAFLDFARNCLRPGGRLIVCADDPGGARLARAAAEAGVSVTTYGVRGPGEGGDGRLVDDAHVRVQITERRADGTSATLTLWSDETTGGGPGPVRPEDCAVTGPIPLALNVPGEADGVRVVDDYAHHPTEIEALLRTARRVAGERGGRVLVLFQPHLFSRTEAFAPRFGAALGLADEVVVAPVYPARETQEDFPLVTGATVADRVPGGARYLSDGRAAARLIADEARPGDLVLTVGAGDVTELAGVVLERLAARAPREGA